MSDNSALTFLPCVFSGINAMPPAGITSARRSVAVGIQVVDVNNDAAANVTSNVVLKGPGEIVAFSPRLIGRVEPPPGENAFESNYFPFIEFTDPDVPWRYSLDNGLDPTTTKPWAKDQPKRMRPWLALIVLRSDEFKVSNVAGAFLPTINVNPKLLPDPDQAWAWAHVQVAENVDAKAVSNTAEGTAKQKFEAALKNINDFTPELTCARLMCPRKLEGQTAYAAFVVPLYEMGINAALGMPVTEKPDFAWNLNDTRTTIDLPVYYQWGFQTAEAGDFEEMLSRLECRNASANFVGRRVDASQPGYFMKNGREVEFYTRGARLHPDMFMLDGALVPPGFMTDQNGRASLQRGGFTTELATSLNKALKTAVLDPNEDEDPLIALPVYGRYFQRSQTLRLPKAGETPDWISETNLDRRLRFVASTGTSVIKDKQDEYVRRCWKQVGAIREANSLLRFGSAGAHVSSSAKQRHLDRLDDFRFVAATRPYHHYYESPAGGVSMKAGLAATGLPQGLLSQTFKRVLAGKAGVRVLDGETLFGDWLTRGSTGGLTTGPAGDTDYGFLSDLSLLQKEVPEYDWRVMPAIPPLKPRVITVTPIDASATLRVVIDGKTDITGRITGLLTLPGNRRLTSLDPLMAAPLIDDPMYRRLTECSLETLSPGLGGIPPNTVLMLEENRKFIEAYLLGLNDEINRELLWHEYPIDQRGTIFKYFWDPVRCYKPHPDIMPIYRWRGGLGSHRGTKAFNKGSHGGTNGFNNVVLVIKGDLIRRYPDTIIFAFSTEKKEADWNWADIHALLAAGGKNSEYTTFNPVFSARTSPDCVFLGFPFSVDEARAEGHYFVMMQHPTLARFGLNFSHALDYTGWDSLSWDDIPVLPPTPSKPNGNGTATATWASAQDFISAKKQKPSGLSINDADWGDDSAAMAWITFQDPVRMVIPASIFLAEKPAES